MTSNPAPVSNRRLSVARTVYEICVGELESARLAFQRDRNAETDRRLRAAWAAHTASTERLNALSRHLRAQDSGTRFEE